MTDSHDAEPPTSQRLDRWLWFARLAKSRTLGAALVSAGKVRVNRERVDKPSQTVRVGDVITGLIQRRVRVVRVAGLGIRRGPPTEARALYEDLSPLPISGGQPRPPESKAGKRLPGTGRPTKRERRLLDRLIGGKS